jgi:hypothetical protein
MPNVTQDDPASELLRNLADRTAHAPAPRGAGRYHYIHTSGWYLRIDSEVRRALGTHSVLGAGIEHMERQQWIAPDGSGRLLVTKDGQSVRPTGDYPPGGLWADFVITTDPAVLADEFRRSNPQGSVTKAISAFIEIWKNQVVPPALQRLLLRDLADHPGLSAEGATLDHIGRPGVAVSHIDHERCARNRLVFDQKTGVLIGADVTALDGSSVPTPTPAIISDIVWLAAGYSATTIEPPQ